MAAAFTFRLDRPDEAPLEWRRMFDQDAAVLAFARQLLDDWPEGAQVDIVQDGALWQRIRRPPI